SLLRQAEASLSTPERAELKTETQKLTPAQEVPFVSGRFDKQAPYVAVASPDAVSLWVSATPGEYSVIPFEQAGSLLEGPLIGHNWKVTFRAALAETVLCAGNVVQDTRIAAFLLNSRERSRELTDILDEPVDTGEPAEVIAAIWEAYNRQKAVFAEQ